ncbi:MAG: GIY-YIG nuclease family protein [bacterium]
MLANTAMPELVKIGRTERHPTLRAQELSEHTGVPTPFVVTFFVEVTDQVLAEAAVAEALQDLRLTSDREFFRLSAETARDVILDNVRAFLPDRTYGPNTPIGSVRCPGCDTVLQFSKLTRREGGFCKCGADVPYHEGQDWNGYSAYSYGVVLPRCPKCRSRMYCDDSESLHCGEPACQEKVRDWI